MRYKTRPARSKWPVLASFVRAGRTLYRFGNQQPEQGELCTAYKVDAESVDTTAHQVPPVWRVPEYPEGLSAVPMGGGGPGRASKRHTEPHISNQAPLVWRAPEGPEGTAVPVGAAGPGCGARGRWGQAVVPVGGDGARLRCPWAVTGPSRGAGGWRQGLAAVPVGGGGAWPGFEPTRRAQLAARTARGRAAAHGHNQQPGPQDSTCGATSNTTTGTTPTRPGIQKTDIRIGCRPVVELGGFEPPTFSLRTRRATNCAIAPRTRTA